MSVNPPMPPTFDSWGARIYNLLRIFNLLLEDSIQEEKRQTQAIAGLTAAVLNSDNAILGRLDQIAGNEDTHLNEQLEAITGLITRLLPPTPGPAQNFIMTLVNSQGEKIMAKATKFGKMKLDLQDDGTAIATLTLGNDKAGLPGTYDGGAPVWTTSDPGVVAAPAADGMSAVLSPSTPPMLVNGVVVTATGTFQDGTSIAGDNSADPINVKAGKAGNFVLTTQSQPAV